MGRPLKSLIGQRFGRLEPIQYLGRKSHSSHWLCRCDCGSETKALSSSLKTGQILSCGCYRRERMSKLTFKHGERGADLRSEITDEYRCWSRMLDRCDRPTEPTYKWYGGKGVTVCQRWRDNFGDFLADVGRKPTKRHSLDRIDSSGNYEPGNCRWATWNEQARNRSNNRRIVFRGREMTLVEAAEVAGIPYKTVKGRLQHKWTVDEALSVPVDQMKVNAARRIAQEA